MTPSYSRPETGLGFVASELVSEGFGNDGFLADTLAADLLATLPEASRARVRAELETCPGLVRGVDGYYLRAELARSLGFDPSVTEESLAIREGETVEKAIERARAAFRARFSAYLATAEADRGRLRGETLEKRLELWNEANGSPFDAPDLAGLAEYIGEGAPSSGPLGSGPASPAEVHEGIAETFPDLSPGQAESLAAFVLANRPDRLGSPRR